MSNEDHRGLVERFLECVNRQDIDGLDDVIAEDYRQRDVSLPQGREGHKRAMSVFIGAFDGLHGEIDQLLFDGPMVGGTFRWQGIHTGTFAGIEGTGRRVEFEAADFWVVRDGAFVEHWGVTDLSPLLGHTEP